jgi:O-antigen/teichoic acid export membrane protein
MTRSALAILAGILVLTVTSFAIEAATNPATIQNVAARIFMLAYTMLCVAAGGYVTAWLARGSEVRHAVIMGVIEAVFTVAAMLALPGHAPLWSWIAGIVLVVPAAWFGGWIRAKIGTPDQADRPVSC